MKIFSKKHQELKDFEEVILDIEKERDTLDECRASIQSCLWNLESPKIEQFDKDWFVKEKKEYFMSLDWDLIWKILQVVALLIIAREIDKRWRKRKNK